MTNISQFSTKQKDEVLEFLNNNKDMTVFGSKSALSKLFNTYNEVEFTNVEEINPNGILSDYKGTDLFELPSKSDLNNKADMIWIVPKQDKPIIVKFIDDCKKFKFTLDGKEV